MTWLITIMIIALAPQAVGVKATPGAHPYLLASIFIIKAVGLIIGAGGALWLLWHNQHIWFAIGYLLTATMIQPKD